MRLVTRGDMDGLTSAVILSVNEPIDSVKLIHPQDITDQRVEIRPDDVLVRRQAVTEGREPGSARPVESPAALRARNSRLP